VFAEPVAVNATGVMPNQTVVVETNLAEDRWVRAIEVQPGDIYLMCSDGLSDMLDDDSIANLLNANASLSEAARALIIAANDSGGRDNIAIILAALAEGITFFAIYLTKYVPGPRRQRRGPALLSYDLDAHFCCRSRSGPCAFGRQSFDCGDPPVRLGAPAFLFPDDFDHSGGAGARSLCL
jgi:hypothetical protein